MQKGGIPVVCSFEVWERVWILNGREVTVDCENKKSYKFKQQPRKDRVKRSPQGLGSKSKHNN